MRGDTRDSRRRRISPIVFDIGVRSVARFLASGLQALFLLLIARELGPAQFGALAVALATATVAGTVLSFGASVRILRVAAEADHIRLSQSLGILRLFGVTLSMVVSWLLCVVVLDLDPVITVVGTTLGAADQLVEYAQLRLTGRGRNMSASTLVVGHRLILMFGLALALANVTSVSYGVVASSLVSIGIALTGSGLGPSSLRALVTDARSSRSYLFLAIANNFSHLEVIALKSVASAQLVGMYSFAARLVNPLTIFSSALQTIAVAEMARREDARHRSRMAKRFLAASTLYGVVLIALSPAIAGAINYLLGRGFQGSTPFLVGMTVVAGLVAPAQMFQGVLILEGRPHVAARTVAAGSAGTVAGLLFVAVFIGDARVWIVPPLLMAFMLAGLGRSALRGPTFRPDRHGPCSVDSSEKRRKGGQS